MYKPLVSIIIPVYNGSNYVRNAIDSAIAQTYENVEIIVVNDGSNDNGATEKICKSYGEKIHYIYKENGGVSSALNLGIKNMRGEFFSWLSHDDLYLPDKIEKQINLINEYKLNNPMVLLCEVKQIDFKGDDLKRTSFRNRFSTNGIQQSEKVLENLIQQGTICGCALLINKCVFEKCGLFNETLRYSQDALMWYKICLNGFDFVYSNDVCVCSRVHNKQLTQTGRNIMFHDSFEIAKEIVPQIIQKTKNNKRILYLYLRLNALWNSKDAFNYGINLADKYKLLHFDKKTMLYAILLYGKIRPIIRRVYYRLFKGVVTQ